MPPKPEYILLAEDDPDDQLTFTEAFNKRYPDVNVVCVDDGDQLLDYLHSCITLPALILMDYKMPIVTAPVVLQRLASNGRFAKIAKMVWSSSIRSDHKDECVSLGALSYMPKPNDSSELDQLIDKIAVTIAL